MKWIEHRRHALRTKPSPHLNADGVRSARELGSRLLKDPKFPGFSRVVTSPKKRAMETAVAMGFPIDATAKILGDLPECLSEISADEAGFKTLLAAWQENSQNRSAIEKALRKFREFFSQELEQIEDGERLLLVSHGGVLEWTTIAAAEDGARQLGAAIDKCDAVEIAYEAGVFHTVRALRDAAL